MDQLQTRLDALEQQMHTVNRRLRWWRGLACGLAVLGLLGWGLPLGLAREDAAEKDKDQKGLAQRVAALEQLLQHFSREQNEIFITGANLHIVNGLGSTDCTGEPLGEDEPPPLILDCPNGLGNLIVGYNESRVPFDGEDIRTGSHNVVVGQEHNFSRFGGMVVGRFNTISGDFAVVSGGAANTASGDFSTVSGGGANLSTGDGAGNTASGPVSVVSGGNSNTASGIDAAVSGGNDNTAGVQASVSGGRLNTASGLDASVSGGFGNTASGERSSVSGGLNITQATAFGWAAGSEADEVVVGNVRSP
jgi:hypothetical protein